MIEIQTSKARIVLVQVSEGANRFTIHGLSKSNNFMYYKKDGECINKKFDFVVGFLATSKTITEDLAKEVVDELDEQEAYLNVIYKDYVKGGKSFNGDGVKGEYIGYTDSIQSFTSLLLSKGVDVSKVYAVLIVK